MISVSDLPALNATLNATSTVLLSLGFYFVRHRQLTAHKRCILGAFVRRHSFASSLIYHFRFYPVRCASLERAGREACTTRFCDASC
jgi:putative membrane protein